MTEQGREVHRYRLDLEVNDEEDPGLITRWTAGLNLTHQGEQPFRVGGNFPTHRFTSDDPGALLELAHRWVGVGTDGHNPDAWEMVAIENAEDGGVLIIQVDAGSPTRGWRDRRVFTSGTQAAIRHRARQDVVLRRAAGDGRFNLLNFSVRVTAPISWTDGQSRETGDALRATIRGYLEELREFVENTHDDVKIEFEL